MLLAFIAVVVGLVLLIWSAEKFIDGAAATSRWLGLSPLLIGMLVIGFGTSAPEMMVSVLYDGLRVYCIVWAGLDARMVGGSPPKKIYFFP